MLSKRTDRRHIARAWDERRSSSPAEAPESVGRERLVGLVQPGAESGTRYPLCPLATPVPGGPGAHQRPKGNDTSTQQSPPDALFRDSVTQRAF